MTIRGRDMKLNALYGRFTADIEAHGRTVLGVGVEGNAPSFAYTIGNWITHELPELLTVGLVDPPVLNMLSEQMIRRRRAFDDGELVDLGGRCSLMVINAGKLAKANYTIQAGRFYGHERYAVQQVLIPDKHGRFPDDPACEPPYRDMPVLRVLS